MGLPRNGQKTQSTDHSQEDLLWEFIIHIIWTNPKYLWFILSQAFKFHFLMVTSSQKFAKSVTPSRLLHPTGAAEIDVVTRHANVAALQHEAFQEFLGRSKVPSFGSAQKIGFTQKNVFWWLLCGDGLSVYLVLVQDVSGIGLRLLQISIFCWFILFVFAYAKFHFGLKSGYKSCPVSWRFV